MSLVSAITPASESARLGRYTLLFRFAAGGMAEVFVGRMQGEGGFEKPVAIKRMLPALAEEPRFVDMFLDEARIAAMVTSPHVVPTLDVGKDDEGSPYIVMELVTGLSLSQLLRFLAEKKTAAPLPMIVDVLAQTAQGLDDAHAARRPSGESLGIIHRDVSPQNVLIGVDGRARLTDFGVARALERVTRTTTGELKGKLSYFSPEQARNVELDQRSDVFAFGVVAWESITGRRLFQRDNPVMTLRAILDEPIPPLTEYRPDAPPELTAAIARALERDRDQRFQTAGELAQALRTSTVRALSRGELGAWVEASGGERLKQFQARIAQAFSTEPATREYNPTPTAADVVLPVEVEPVASTTRARTSAATPPPGVAGETPPVASPTRASWLAGAALLIALVFAVGFFAFGSPAAPSAAVAPPVTPLSTHPLSTPASITVVPAPIAVAAPPVGPAAAPDETASPQEAVVPSPALAPRARVEPRTVVTVPVAPVAVAAQPEPPEAAPQREHPAPEPHRAVTSPPPEEAPPPPSTTGRRGRLIGLDQFQRETTTP